MSISHKNLNSAVFAGGCFWCVEHDFSKRPDTKDIESGYTGGESEEPTYEDHTGHREVVRVWFDPDETSYKELVAFFFTTHNPTDEGGSFGDRGHSYTSAIYYQNDQEREVAQELIEQLNDSGIFDESVATAVEPLDAFWTAEEYHQEYAKKNPTRYKWYRKASGREKFVNEHRDEIYAVLMGNGES